ncbi:MAG TPA: alcohol dehydrogenase catalytic domain-containing protein [Acidimicrobiales bacterium]|nr:alcohol dehydrogenase catalytic domain-containing protein [Acidimicrobiales bacterium]
MRSTEQGIRVVDTGGADHGGVRVSVVSSGICASDLHLASAGPTPVTLGHEFSGRLDDGTPVAVLPVVFCGDCDRCRAGDEQQCAHVLSAMYGVSLDGGLADEAWVDPTCAKVVPPSLPLEQACLVEPFAVALHGVHRARVQSGARVLVIGAGPIGLCAIATLGSLGADVDLLARHQRRIEAGERLGAGTSAGADYDIVLDAAGTQRSLDTALRRVRPGGTIGVIGTFWGPVTLGAGFQLKEVTLTPAFTYGHYRGVPEFVTAMRVLESIPDLADTIVTHHFSLDEAAAAFRVAGDRGSGAIKVVVHP